MHGEIIEELHKHLYIKFTPKEESSKKGNPLKNGI